MTVMGGVACIRRVLQTGVSKTRIVLHLVVALHTMNSVWNGPKTKKTTGEKGKIRKSEKSAPSCISKRPKVCNREKSHSISVCLMEYFLDHLNLKRARLSTHRTQKCQLFHNWMRCCFVMPHAAYQKDRWTGFGLVTNSNLTKAFSALQLFGCQNISSVAEIDETRLLCVDSMQKWGKSFRSRKTINHLYAILSIVHVTKCSLQCSRSKCNQNDATIRPLPCMDHVAYILHPA